MPIAMDTTAPAPAEFPLLTHVDELVEDLRTNVSKALKQFDIDAIHQARVATRRLKAALDLFKPVLTGDRRRPFARELRKLRRRLGPLRDLDVMLDHLREYEQDPRLAPAAAWLAGALCGQREAARAVSREDAAPAKVLARLGRWWGLREEVTEAGEAVDALLAESLHLQVDAFAEQADRLLAHQQAGATKRDKAATAATTTTAAAAAPAAPADAATVDIGRVDPHELRIAGKALRYTLEMAAKQGHPLPKNVAKMFKQMQECLGLWHDYVVLSDRMLTAAVERLLGHFDPATHEKVLDLAKLALRKSTRELDRFSKLWSERGEELTRSIRVAFPLTRSITPAAASASLPAAMPVVAAAAGGGDGVSGSRTDPGPPRSEPSSTPAPCPPVAASAV